MEIPKHIQELVAKQCTNDKTNKHKCDVCKKIFFAPPDVIYGPGKIICRDCLYDIRNKKLED